MLNLVRELAAVNCITDPETFRGLVVEMFADCFGNWTDEDLLCRPREGIRFCNLVRECVACNELDDYVILRTLTNVRKHGRPLNGGRDHCVPELTPA